MTLLEIIFLSFLILFSIAIFILLFLIIRQRIKIRKNSIHFIKEEYQELNNKIKEKEKELEIQILEYHNKLLKLSNTTNEELKKEVSESYKKIFASNLLEEINEYKTELKENKIKIISNILIDSYQNISQQILINSNTGIVKLEDNNLKGRIIGKNGRNKKIFEYLTGTDLLIDKISDIITISSLNPIRREVGKRTLEELIKSKNIDPSRIENTYAKVLEEFDSHVKEIGKDVLNNKLHIYDMDEKVYKYIGNLYYRNSYSQNILSHSIECAQISMNIASSLGLDPEKAKRATFFHDIGKSIDNEVDKTHIESGVMIAKECNFDDYIIESIKTHHNDGIITSIYSEITKIADTISASRPGARVDSFDEYVERVNRLELICNEFDEVSNSYVIKSGRQLRVMINPKKIKDYKELELLSLKIKESIEADEKIGSYKINIILIKEDKVSIETSINKKTNL